MKNPFLNTVLWTTLLFVSTSCLKEIKIEAQKIEGQLVVEGLLNTVKTTHQVKLFSTIQLDNMAPDRRIGENARVEILEIGGPTYSLTEISPSRYQTSPNELIIEPGKSYQLKIELSNGDKYQSSIQTALKPLTILSSEAVFDEKFVERDGITRKIIGHDLLLTIENTDEEHFFFVQDKGWAEVDVTYGGCETIPGRPICWSYRDPIIPRSVIIGSNKLIGGKSYTVKTVKVPVDAKRPYVANMGLSSISEENYLFWKAVNAQLNRSGSIFDAPIAPIIGNISHVNGNKTPLGFFHVYSTTEEIICFTRENIDVIATSPLVPCNVSCIDYWAPGTYDDIEEIYCEN